MPSTKRPVFSNLVSSLILAFFCLLLAPTTSASCAFYIAARNQDHSPAYGEGLKALIGADYEKAVELFQQAAADKPDDMWAFYYLGLCFLNLKRFDEAANAYQQAMRIKPYEAPVHYQLGKTYLEKGDPEAARNEFVWLQDRDKELALYLSDLFPADNPASKEPQELVDPPAKAKTSDKSAEPMTRDQRPTILYREKAKYTEIARINRVQGTVALQVVFDASGAMRDIRVIRKLPDGLTRGAIEAAKKIRFNPAIKNGEPISVRGALEFTFNLY